MTGARRFGSYWPRREWVTTLLAGLALLLWKVRSWGELAVYGAVFAVAVMVWEVRKDARSLAPGQRHPGGSPTDGYVQELALRRAEWAQQDADDEVGSDERTLFLRIDSSIIGVVERVRVQPNGLIIQRVDVDSRETIIPTARILSVSVRRTWRHSCRRVVVQHHDSTERLGPMPVLDAEQLRTAILRMKG